MDKSLVRYSSVFFFMWTLASFFMNVKALAKIIKAFWWVDQWLLGLILST